MKKMVINPEYESLRSFVEELPVSFDNRGEIIYSGRNVVRDIPVQNIHINVKRFKVPNFINQLVYGNFRKSKARRSFEYANILIQNGIGTPDPIAYIEQKSGILFRDSYYVSVHEQFDGLMREFKWGQLAGRENLLDQFARFTASMHDKEIMHIDYSPGNILYKEDAGNYTFYLVDLNRMYFGPVSMEKGCENLRRLWGNEEMLTYIATKYAQYRQFDADECVALVLKYHREFWDAFTKKHKDRTPYIG